MTHRSTAAILALALGAAAPAPSAPAAEKPVRVLLVYGGHGFDTNQFFATFDALPGIRVERAKFPEVAARLKPGLEKDFDVIVRYDMFRPSSPEDRKNFLDLMATGIGLVATHHCIASHPDWPEYARLIGGKYFQKPETIDGKEFGKSNYSHDEDVAVKVVDGTHPVSKGIADFTIHEETYGNMYVSPDVRVLMKTDHPKATPELVWVREQGPARIAYIQLGHDAKAYANPAYQAVIRQAILWAAKRDGRAP
jgi:hypothetical protein